MYRATCRHCGKEIIRHPTGVWMLTSGQQGLTEDDCDLVTLCQRPAPPDHIKMPHEPMPDRLKGEPRWSP